MSEADHRGAAVRADPAVAGVKHLGLGVADGDEGAWAARFAALRERLGEHAVVRGVGVRAEVEPGSAAPTAALLVWAPQDAHVPADALAASAPAGERWRPLLRLADDVVVDTDYVDGAVLRLGLTRRLAGLSRAEYARHWKDVHVPLVMGAGPLFDRYVVNIVEHPGEDVDGPDGVVEQQFPDEATCREHDRQVLEDKPAVLADVRTFVGGAEQFVGRVAARWPARRDREDEVTPG
jgi:hypothetical protein